MSAERSAIVDRWLGAPEAHQGFADYLGRKDPKAAAWLSIGFSELVAQEMPLEVVVDQLPKQANLGTHTLALEYTPIAHAGVVTHLLVVMTDVSAEIQRQRLERQQREMLALFQAISADRGGFLEFLEEASRIVDGLRNLAGADRETEQRLVHTLKGNAGLYRLDALVQICHDVESRLVEERTALTDGERAEIAAAWERVQNAANELLGEKGAAITIDAGDYATLGALVREGAGAALLERTLRSWQLDPVSLRFESLSRHIRQLASRLGKAAPHVRLDAGGLRLDATTWAGFWSAFVHVARNAVDHGIEDAETRVGQGKAPEGTIWLTADLVEGQVVIRLQDDGRGIDWERVAQRAAGLGLPHATRDDLEAALFADGVSTRSVATTTSGRGVGLAALREATLRMGGRIVVRSERNVGTSFEFRIEDAAAFQGSRAVRLAPPAIRLDEPPPQTGALPT
jgi:two-component system chemotaxis sensor kinase CheA